VLAVWGRRGTSPGEFDLPGGIAVDGQGNVYVADTRNHRIQKLSPQGQRVTQ
jgi:DNA-binding beta-propeller fold protein YncE